MWTYLQICSIEKTYFRKAAFLNYNEYHGPPKLLSLLRNNKEEDEHEDVDKNAVGRCCGGDMACNGVEELASHDPVEGE